MIRGVIAGMLAGAAVSVAGAVGVSLLIGPPGPSQDAAATAPDSAAEPAETVTATAEDSGAPAQEPAAPVAPGRVQTEVVQPPAPTVSPSAAPTVDAPDAAGGFAGVDTDPGAPPVAGDIAANLSQAPAESSPAAPAGAIAPPPAALAPVAEAPRAPTPDSGIAPAEPTAAADQLALATEAPQEPATDTGAGSGAAPEVTETVPETPSEAPAAAPPATPAEAQAETQAEAPAEAPAAESPTETPAEPPAAAPAETPAAQAPAEAARPTIGRPAVPLTERPSDRVSSRLPSVGGAPATGGESLAPRPSPLQPAGPEAETGADSAEAAEELPPIRRHAAGFDTSDTRPRMAIILIDQGEFTTAVEALASFPYPVSFAIDPQAEDAAETMARYRAAGFEVLTLVDLPEAASAVDVEVALSVMLDRLPESVAVLEGAGAGVQGSREVSDQVTAILAASGHGMVMQPKGLDTARKLAQREGVPAATVFRDLDSQGQDAAVIRRFLDQAAFRAGQEEQGVIMIGRTRPETVSALILWGLADRASRVALAPVSALLLDDAAE